MLILDDLHEIPQKSIQVLLYALVCCIAWSFDINSFFKENRLPLRTLIHFEASFIIVKISCYGKSACQKNCCLTRVFDYFCAYLLSSNSSYDKSVPNLNWKLIFFIVYLLLRFVLVYMMQVYFTRSSLCERFMYFSMIYFCIFLFWMMFPISHRHQYVNSPLVIHTNA